MFVLSLKEYTQGFNFHLKEYLVKSLVSRCSQYASKVVKQLFLKTLGILSDVL